MKKLIILLFFFFMISQASASYYVQQDNYTGLIACTTPSCTNAFDNDFNTYVRVNSAHIYWYYEKPEYSTSAYLNVRVDSNWTNITIPQSCWDWNETSVKIKFLGSDGSFEQYSAGELKCVGESGDVNLMEMIGSNYERYDYFYEDTIYFLIEPPTPQHETTELYQTMNSAGAGLGIFIQYMGTTLPTLAIILTIIIVLVAIMAGLGKIISEKIKKSR